MCPKQGLHLKEPGPARMMPMWLRRTGTTAGERVGFGGSMSATVAVAIEESVSIGILVVKETGTCGRAGRGGTGGIMSGSGSGSGNGIGTVISITAAKGRPRGEEDGKEGRTRIETY